MYQRLTRRPRHTARARGWSGIPAARYLTPPGPPRPAVQGGVRYDTAPLFLPLLPALSS